MSWYKKYKTANKKVMAKTSYVTQEVFDALKEVADKISKGCRNWNPEELELQANYPQELEWFVNNHRLKAKACN